MLVKAAPAAGALATGAAAATGAGAVGKGLLGKLGKFSGGVGGLVGGVALDYAGSKAEESGHHKLAGGLGIGSSALSGAGMGATIGSIVPGIGTAVGGAVGGALGAGYGLYQNWGKFSGSPSTPATNAKGALTPPDAQQSGASGGSAATPDAGYTSLTKDVGLYDKITELVDVNKTLVKIMQGVDSGIGTLKDTAQKHLRIVS
jgi:phage tail tape-measure protein